LSKKNSQRAIKVRRKQTRRCPVFRNITLEILKNKKKLNEIEKKKITENVKK
jgi:hypothetical protein